MEVVLEEAAGLALRTGTRIVEPAALEQACRGRGLDHDQWFAALVALRDQRLIQVAASEPSTVMLIALTNAGLMRHLATTRPDLADVAGRLAAAAVEAHGGGAVPLADLVGEAPLLVECLLDTWVEERRIVYSKAPVRRFRIHRITGDLPGPPAAAPEASAGGATSAEPTRP